MDCDDKHRYDDMLNMTHPTSAKHPRMSPVVRAAQFSPFAALTGYDEQVREAARLTGRKTELDENTLAFLDMRMQIIADHINEHPEIEFTYFVADERKAGGSYVTIKKPVKRIEEISGHIIFMDKSYINIDDIVGIDGELFKGIGEVGII